MRTSIITERLIKVVPEVTNRMVFKQTENVEGKFCLFNFLVSADDTATR